MHLFGRTQWLLMGCLLLSASGLMAQEYPSRVVRIVVGETPGSGGDIVARMVSQKLTAAWGQQVIVDNRPGANGIIGAETVARAKPDGYTLLTGVVSMLAMNQVVYKKLPYDSLRDFAPISQITTNHFALVVTPSLPARSVAELVKLAKSRPGEMLFGSSGVGNQNHLSSELFARAAGIKIVHVSHKGTNPATVSLLSGEVPMMIAAASPVLAHIADGRLRLLATAGTRRAPTFPDTPTLVESGYPEVVIIGGTGLLAPIGTPPDIVNKLSGEIARQLVSADVRAALSDKGRDVTPTTPKEYEAFLRGEIEKWAKVIRAVGLENSQ